MNGERVKDLSATAIGGGLGLDQLFRAIDDLFKDGATSNEWVALAKGVLLIVFGFFAWKRQQPEQQQP